MSWFWVKKFKEKEYKVNIVLFALMLVLEIFLIVANISFNPSGNTMVYLHCPDSSLVCSNPYFESNVCSDASIDSRVCSQEYLRSGESIGIKPPWFVNGMTNYFFTLLGVWVIANTLLYNKDFFRRDKHE